MHNAFLQVCLITGAILPDSPVYSQEPDSIGEMFGPSRQTASELTVESIFGNNELMPKRVGTIEWMGDGSFTVCESAKGGNQSSQSTSGGGFHQWGQTNVDAATRRCGRTLFTLVGVA